MAPQDKLTSYKLLCPAGLQATTAACLANKVGV